MQNIEKLMESANTEYYSERGKHIYYDFKTFAASQKLGRACAIEFLEQAQKEEGELKIYEIGVGGGNFALNFLKNIKQMNPTISKNITYVLWDLSAKLLDLAEEKLGDFPIEKICAPAEEVEKMKNPFWIRGNEILDDVPARVFLRKGEKIYEVGTNNREFCAQEAPSVPGEIAAYMGGAPQDYWIPVNMRAAKLVEEWKEKLSGSGKISLLDYGFIEAEGPVELWNDSVIRKYGEEYTVDVNFDFILKKVGGKLEAQDEFVNRSLSAPSFAVEREEGMDYLSSEEIDSERKKLEVEGYDIDLLKRGKESNPYFHYSISV